MNYADFSKRLLAHNIDLLFLIPFFYLLSFLISSDLLLAGGCFFTYLLYHVFFEIGNWKGTPGKRLLHLEVRNESSRFPLAIALALRNLLKSISLLVFFLGFFMIAFSRKRQGFHDWLVGTVVVIAEK